MPILVSYFRLLGAKTRRTLSSKDVLGGENLAVNSHYLDYNALKKNISTIFSLMFMVCFSIFRFITQYSTNTLESFVLFCKKKCHDAEAPVRKNHIYKVITHLPADYLLLKDDPLKTSAFVLIMITLECSVTYFNQKLLTLIILYNTLKEKHNTHPNHLKHQTY